MKYLSTYTLFERVSKETKLFESIGIKILIEDVLIDMSDDDIQVKVAISEDSELIEIQISKGGKYFDITKYLQCFESLNDILESEGYETNYLDVVFRKSVVSHDKDFKNINNLLNPENVTSKDFKWSDCEVCYIYIEIERENK